MEPILAARILVHVKSIWLEKRVPIWRKEEDRSGRVEAGGAEGIRDVLGAIGAIEVYSCSIGYQREVGGMVVPLAVFDSEIGRRLRSFELLICAGGEACGDIERGTVWKLKLWKIVSV